MRGNYKGNYKWKQSYKLNKSESTAGQIYGTVAQVLEEMLCLRIHLSENEKEFKWKSWAFENQVEEKKMIWRWQVK